MKKMLFFNAALLAVSLSTLNYASAPKPAANSATDNTAKSASLKTSDVKENAEGELSEAAKHANQATKKYIAALGNNIHAHSNTLLHHIAFLLEAQELANHKRFDALEREIASLKAELANKQTS